jgi:hypothetical protein
MGARINLSSSLLAAEMVCHMPLLPGLAVITDSWMLEYQKRAAITVVQASS